MRKYLMAVAAVLVAFAAIGVALWQWKWPNPPIAIVLASVQSDTLDGMNGVDPIAPALRDLGYQVLSIDLPCHSSTMQSSGLVCWANRIGMGETNLLSGFCTEVSALIDSTGARRVQMVGVSRGGYVAFECGALDDRVTEIAQIAPVVSLADLTEFDGVKVDPAQFSLSKYADKLRGKETLIRIGRFDDRVDTNASIMFGSLIGAEVQLLDSDGHRAPDPENVMAAWLKAKWDWPF
jgi:pimeloyl-ACP methyl ester carboxylesterase